MTDDWKSRVKDAAKGAASGLVEDAADVAGYTRQLAKDTYDRTGLRSKVHAMSDAAKDLLEEAGVIDTAARFSKVAGDQLDTLSGAKLLALVEERLSIQSKYNDILATKLQEALDRIKILEEMIATPSK